MEAKDELPIESRLFVPGHLTDYERLLLMMDYLRMLRGDMDVLRKAMAVLRAERDAVKAANERLKAQNVELHAQYAVFEGMQPKILDAYRNAERNKRVIDKMAREVALAHRMHRLQIPTMAELDKDHELLKERELKIRLGEKRRVIKKLREQIISLGAKPVYPASDQAH